MKNLLLGLYFEFRGDLPEALKQYKKDLNDPNISYKGTKFSLLVNVGHIYYEKGNYDEAKKYFLAIIDEAMDTFYKDLMWEPYYQLIRIGVIQSNVQFAEVYLEKLKELEQKFRRPGIKLRLQIAKVLILNEKHNFKDSVTAVEILENIVQQPVYLAHLTIQAMLILAEMYLLELKTFSSNELYETAKTTV